ncbi:MAG: PD-(D/E)XK nuclease family transposase, partial [Thermoguttaceae bacterium]|nr:PD-(D/E)XK nuclease family transposase [Thermoguttaceae bacterium]
MRVFSCFSCLKFCVSLCVFSVFSGETGTQFPDEPIKKRRARFCRLALFFAGRRLIESVEIENPFNVANFANQKTSIVDVKAKDEKGKTYDI